MKSISGIALITVLLFLQIFAILGLCAIQMAWIETKQSREKWQSHVRHQMANDALNKIEKSLNQECLIPITPINQLITYSLSWWQFRSNCAGNFRSFQYYYRIEFLGFDPCAYAQEKYKIIAKYYRITLVGVEDNIKIVLQSTVISPIHDGELSCSKKPHNIKVGRQMMREIYP